jgi:hypothetical protein
MEIYCIRPAGDKYLLPKFNEKMTPLFDLVGVTQKPGS